jgi:hypothetical protein
MDTLNGRWTGRNYFVRHFLEMLVAMIVGMAVLGMAASSIFALLGHTNLYHYAGLRAVLMASYMAVGMTLWMRHRGHGWPTIREMSAAMFAPFLLLMVPFWAGLISGGALLAGGHLLMLPTMLGAMLYRREEYSQIHRHHPAAPPTRPAVDHRMHA